jgi:hypothetical protein
MWSRQGCFLLSDATRQQKQVTQGRSIILHVFSASTTLAQVPNVKLRPPPPTTRVLDASCDHLSDSSDAPPNASMVDLCPRPFRGVTICATGTMDKVRPSIRTPCLA